MEKGQLCRYRHTSVKNLRLRMSSSYVSALPALWDTWNSLKHNNHASVFVYTSAKSLTFPYVHAQVVDGATLSVAGSSTTLCLSGQPGKTVIVLVWHDYPGTQNAARALVNDLDLVVRADSLNGLSLRGNGVTDRVNNVERVCNFISLHFM